jgi:hypothetical protein
MQENSFSVRWSLKRFMTVAVTPPRLLGRTSGVGGAADGVGVSEGVVWGGRWEA